MVVVRFLWLSGTYLIVSFLLRIVRQRIFHTALGLPVVPLVCKTSATSSGWAF